MTFNTASYWQSGARLKKFTRIVLLTTWLLQFLHAAGIEAGRAARLQVEASLSRRVMCLARFRTETTLVLMKTRARRNDYLKVDSLYRTQHRRIVVVQAKNVFMNIAMSMRMDPQRPDCKGSENYTPDSSARNQKILQN
jgi:hypothetical protein